MLGNRKYEAGNGYRYGFNGKEEDDEVKGEGNTVAFEARIYDSRLGRFLSIDPLEREYPSQSPYVFAHNNPIALIDYLGMGDPPDPDCEIEEMYQTTTVKPSHTTGTMITTTISRIKGNFVPNEQMKV